MEEPKRWAERFARAGFVAKGIVYLIIGWLAFRAGSGRGGDVTDSEGAIRSLLSATQGRVLIGALAIGLAGYALWRLLEALADANRKGTDIKGIAARAGYALSGAIYGSPLKHRQGRTALANVYLCGTDQGFLGIVGAMLSGISMANYHILQKPG